MKSKPLLITSACVAALLFGGPSLAFAASKKKTAATAPSPAPSAAASPAKAPSSIPFRGKATAIDKSAKTFTIKGVLTSRVFKVTDKTVITKMDAPAKFADLTENEEVTGSYWKQADGSHEARSLKIGGKTEAEKATAAAAKAKRDAKKEMKKSDASPSAEASASPAPKKK